MVSLLYGAITHHYLNSHLPYCNQINNYGSIYNQNVAVMIGNNESKFGIFKGRDSACGNIFGPISSFTIDNNLEFLIGGYSTNHKEFKNLKIQSPSIMGITPIFGFDFRFPIYENKNFKMTIDSLVSYGVIVQALRFDFL